MTDPSRSLSERSETKRPAPPAHAPRSLSERSETKRPAPPAHAFLLAGSRVTVVERDADSVEAAATRIREALGRVDAVLREKAVPATNTSSISIALVEIVTGAATDAAMELGYRHPVGPLRTTDLVGLDVRLGIAEDLHAKLGERFAPPELLRTLVAQGHLGRKTGRGFYERSTP